jgi:hypothetical protein
MTTDTKVQRVTRIWGGKDHDSGGLSPFSLPAFDLGSCTLEVGLESVG